MRTLLFLVLAVFMFVGCVPQQKAMYKWENYSSTLYDFKKNPNEETQKKHRETLQKIIDKSKKEAIRVPPGVFCEYGFFLLKEGKKEEALKYFELEEKTYPESAVFVQRFKSQMNKNEGATTNETH